MSINYSNNAILLKKDGSKLMKQYRNNEPTVYLFSSSVSGVSVQQLAQLINPLGPYRIQWDTQLKEIELLERVNKVSFVDDKVYTENRLLLFEKVHISIFRLCSFSRHRRQLQSYSQEEISAVSKYCEKRRH